MIRIVIRALAYRERRCGVVREKFHIPVAPKIRSLPWRAGTPVAPPVFFMSFARVWSVLKSCRFSREEAEKLKREIDLRTIPSIPEK
jgi:hypothetical protein